MEETDPQPCSSKETERKDEEIKLFREQFKKMVQPCKAKSTDLPKAQEYDDISEVSNVIEKPEGNAKQDTDDGDGVTDVSKYSEQRLQLKLLSEKRPFTWVYLMDHPVDPPEYIPGFNLKLPLKYTFEFVFPNLFRRMYMPPPYIPYIFLFWTCRNPSVLRHLMEKIASTSLGIVVECLKKETAVRILFWKVGLAALFGSHDASFLLRFAAYRLLKKDFRSAFYLYIAAMIRITRKLETLKNTLKCKDKDVGEVTLRLSVVRKHPRVKSAVIKMKRRLMRSSILKTKSLVKKVFYIKKVHVRKMFRQKKEILKFFTLKNHRVETSAEQIASDLALDLDFSDCGETSTDKDFEYQYLFREIDEECMRKCIFKITVNERYRRINKEPVPDLKRDMEKYDDLCSKVITLNFPSESSDQNNEHLETCIGSLMNPDVSYLTEKVISFVLKSFIRAELDVDLDFNIPIKCMDIETTKHIFQNILSNSLNSKFCYMSREHPILDLPLKYLDINLQVLGKMITQNLVRKDKLREVYKRIGIKVTKNK